MPPSPTLAVARNHGPRRGPFRTLPRWLLLIAAALAASSALYVDAQLQRGRSAEEQKLLAIADLKAREVERRREDLERHAAAVARQERVVELAAELAAGVPAEDLRATAVLDEIAAAERYATVRLVALGGRVLASSSGVDAEELRAPALAVTVAALDERRIAVAQPVQDDAELRVVTAVPVNGWSGSPTAGLVMESRAEQTLLRDVARWPVPSASGEIRVVRRDGAPAELLSGSGDAASALAGTAETARAGVVRRDGDGSGRALVALRPIAGTQWALVASVDLAEVDQPTWTLAIRVAAIAGILLAAAAVALALAARQRAAHEASISSSERRASAGRLAAGTAHELNSPLASALASARFALDELRAMPATGLRETMEALEDVVEATQRAAAVVRSLQVVALGGPEEERRD